jgi:alpha 1,3-glucosidase
VRNNDNTGMYVGDCWPKESVWVDYLNSNAVQYWKGLYKYEKFKGTSNVFNFWIDMNEPSVFSGDELTMDKRSLHLTDKGILFEHKDVHNAYGLLMAKATF